MVCEILQEINNATGAVETELAARDVARLKRMLELEAVRVRTEEMQRELEQHARDGGEAAERVHLLSRGYFDAACIDMKKELEQNALQEMIAWFCELCVHCASFFMPFSIL